MSLYQRAYNLIWNEWFRDENLQTSVPQLMGDGPDDTTNFSLLRRGKRKDYFTGALPWPQKGAAVTLPLGSVAPIKFQHPGAGTLSSQLLGQQNFAQSGKTIPQIVDGEGFGIDGSGLVLIWLKPLLLLLTRSANLSKFGVVS